MEALRFSLFNPEDVQALTALILKTANLKGDLIVCYDTQEGQHVTTSLTD